jgi:phenylpropionate dioxygenase-like ring-hydroxylating dioxygenase large terminal subunit
MGIQSGLLALATGRAIQVVQEGFMIGQTAKRDFAEAMNGKVKDPVLFDDWHVVARSQDLQPGTVVGARLLDTDLVLWRGQDTQILAWDDRCPHRSVRLSVGKVVEDTLVCSYHGMVYNPEGRCIKVPSHPDYVPPKQACVRTYSVKEQYGLVFVCLGEPNQDISAFPEWGVSGYRTILCGPHYCRSGGYRAIENFLDLAHFPFVHTGILGDPTQTSVKDYEVSASETGIRLHNIQIWQPDPVGLGEGAFVTYNYWTLRPLTAYLTKETPTGEGLAILYCVTPVSEEECIGWMCIAINYGDPSQDHEIQNFQDKVVLQDVVNLESHNPKRLPLNMQAEFHVPCDRGSLAYRKWLKNLGVTYGVLT